MKKYLFIVLLVGVWGCRSQKPQNNLYIYDPETFGLSKKALIKMSNEVFKYVDDGKIPFVSKAIIKDNHLIYFDSYGYADIESKKEIRDDSIFRIYSMTKPIVSVAIMILIERGIIALDDPVKNYLKEFNELVVFNDSLKFKKPENDMSISDLLSHKSGLGYGWGSNAYLDSMYAKIWDKKNNQEFVTYLSSIPLFFDPKTEWRYGVSTDVLGRIIEVVTKQTLYDFLNDNIFKPLEMFDTHFQIPKHKLNRFVSNYRFDKITNNLIKVDDWQKTRYRSVTLESGGGGLISTMSNYINFCLMISNDGKFKDKVVLSAESINIMTKNQIGNINYPWDKGVKFGYGFSVVTDKGLSALNDSNGSFGWNGAAGTHFTIDPEKNLILILMVQRMYPWSGVWEKFNDLTYDSIIDNSE